MSLRNLLLAAFACMMLQCVSRGSNDDFKEEIAALKMFPDEPAAPIQLWDGQVIVAKYDQAGPRYYRIDHLKSEQFDVPGLRQILSVSYGKDKAVVLGRYAGELRLLHSHGAIIETVPLPSALKKAKSPWLIPSTDAIAVVDDRTMYQYKDGSWTHLVIPKVPKFNKEFKPEHLGYKQYLYGSKLFAGWNAGEWGGMLAVLDLDHPNRGWKQVSGKKLGDQSGIIGNIGISGMTVDGSGSLWVSEGCCHMGGMWRGLYRYDGKLWETIVHGAFDKSEGGKISFPGETTDVVDVFAVPDGKVYVLGGALGVFRYDGQGLNPIVEINFYGISQPHFKMLPGRKIDTIIPCYPTGLVGDAKGNLYVSTGYYGILCFVPDGKKYHLKQIVLPGAKE